MEYRKDLGKGVQIVRFKKPTPLESLKEIGRSIAIRKRLESEKVGIPEYTKSQKKKIRKDVTNYFNSLGNKYGH